MKTVKISMRGFAEVASAPPNRKKAVFERYRSPKSGESVGRSNYYVKALSLIKRHHRGDVADVKSAIRSLHADALAEADPRKKTKLLSNHRAIIDYLERFGHRNLEIKQGRRMYFVFEDLIVSAQPDIVAEENGNLILIKLNLGKKDLPGGVAATLLHVLYEAAKAKGLPVRSDGVECLQTSSGSKTVGPKTNFPNKDALKAKCRELLLLS
jgi:hypothetical protein